MKSTLMLIALMLGSPVFAAPEYPRMGPDIFDPKARAETLIDGATVRARPEQKRILLLFGANWCPWCRRLHRILGTDPRIATPLQQHFVVVYVDANTRND